ncbi:uncharacterized protein LOC118479335 [Helianthus annuus]|uniref:uncharacterized protein LOC118479335 n=1 Tax=Helianthus annuus TaxID=4232 RepID=UPI001652FFAE|nr:uncharacterized protein LOC118479335 [Helianthus annuus]
MNGFSNWVGGANGTRGSMGFQDPRNTNSSTLGQPTTPNQFNTNQNQGILGPRPNVSSDGLQIRLHNIMGFGHTSSDSMGSIPSFDTPHFGQSHFNSWAADQTTQHYGFSATLSDLCQTVEAWIPYSGATAHMTSDVSLVHGAVPYTGTENVIVGNDSNRADPPPHAVLSSPTLFLISYCFYVTRDMAFTFRTSV